MTKEESKTTKSTRYGVSRKKACKACVAAKAKCDRLALRCSRCSSRGLSCVYPQAGIQPDSALHSRVNANEDCVHAKDSLATPNVTGGCPYESSSRNSPDGTLDLAVTDDDLMCPINAAGISIRWMNAYVPAPEQTVKTYHPSTISFLRRVLKSYAGMAIRGRPPPFIHSSQLDASRRSSDAVVVCLSLARICDTGLSGASAASDAAAAVLSREMDRLYVLAKQGQHGQTSDARPSASVNHLASLSIFQAYLLYALLLFFQLERQADPFLRQAIVALQEIACITARHGLVCTQPFHWGAWVIAEAKRRTLYTMYMFDNMLSAHDGLTSYLGVELRGLPAPFSKALWQARTISEWKETYRVYVEDWAREGVSEGTAGAPGPKRQLFTGAVFESTSYGPQSA